MLFETVADAVKVLEELREKSVEEIAGDTILLGGVLWYLYLAVQGCIDIALKTISKLTLRAPESYADAFSPQRGRADTGGASQESHCHGPF
nr:hypothetical protein [Candidatus Freyarchaeota archaeon]